MLITCCYIAIGSKDVVCRVWFVWVHRVMPRSVLDLFTGWQVNVGRHRCAVVWGVVPHCVLWCLWRAQNTHHFEDCERTIPELKLLFFQTLYEWVVGFGIFPIHSLVELIDICTF